MREVNHILAAGTPAPEFSLHTTPDQLVSLSDFRGQPVILAFYPADWSPVCGDQMALYNELLGEFHGSVPSCWAFLLTVVVSSRVRARTKTPVPLLSDFEPKGRVARMYGAYREEDGTTERALFVIDGEGVIRWSYRSPVGVNPGADGILRALDALKGEAAHG
jgi:peroxiredoxin